MDTLDGNAIAGTLFDVFGEDMTTVAGSCVQCGRTGVLAEITVYLNAPGIVARCSQCDNLLIVIVERCGTACVDLTGLSSLT